MDENTIGFLIFATCLAVFLFGGTKIKEILIKRKIGPIESIISLGFKRNARLYLWFIIILIISILYSLFLLFVDSAVFLPNTLIQIIIVAAILKNLHRASFLWIGQKGFSSSNFATYFFEDINYIEMDKNIGQKRVGIKIKFINKKLFKKIYVPKDSLQEVVDALNSKLNKSI